MVCAVPGPWRLESWAWPTTIPKCWSCKPGPIRCIRSSFCMGWVRTATILSRCQTCWICLWVFRFGSCFPMLRCGRSRSITGPGRTARRCRRTHPARRVLTRRGGFVVSGIALRKNTRWHHRVVDLYAGNAAVRGGIPPCQSAHPDISGSRVTRPGTRVATG